MNLSKGSKTTRVMNAVAAGTTDQNSSSVDMQNFEGVEFTAFLGALTAGQVTTMKLQTSSDNSAWNDLLGTQTAAMDDADDNQCIILDLYKPVERYIRAVLERATQNAVIDGIVAKQYLPRVKPTTHDSATVQEAKMLVSPIEGTA